MLKKPASGVLASLKGSTYRQEYDSPFRSLRPSLRRGASRRAGAGRVTMAGFLSILAEKHRRVTP